jgi:hypothetical protein
MVEAGENRGGARAEKLLRSFLAPLVRKRYLSLGVAVFLRAKISLIRRDFVTVMPALLEPAAEEIEALNRSAADSLPRVEPHNRYKPRQATRIISIARICFALIVVGVVLRAWQLDQVPGVNGDEAWYGVQSQRFLDEYVYAKELSEAERVTFRTPTGNWWNPFLMVPRIVLDVTFAPSIWSLRLPAFISGVLTLLLNWWLCRRAINKTTAWLTTALLAVLPIAMIYSRLGWDTCQSVFFCLPLVYLPWMAERQALSGIRTAIYSALVLGAALLVHPTNIFVVPLSAVLFWPRLRAAAQSEWSLRSRAFLITAALGGATALGIMRGAWAGVELGNLFSALAQWVGDVVGLFDGATVYGSISLPADELPAAQHWLLLLSLPTVALLLWMRISCKTALFPQQTVTSSQRYAAFFDGTCMALLCFLGAAGPAAIQPGYERYGLWMIAPSALLIVLAYSRFARRSRGALGGIMSLAMVQLALLLAGYWQYYQQRFDVPAAEQRLAHWTYRADNFAEWSEMRSEFEHSIAAAGENNRKLIFILANDPKRWWFEWKWRYLSHRSAYEWQVLSNAQDALIARSAGEDRWILRSLSESAKEKLSIQYLAK